MCVSCFNDQDQDQAPPLPRLHLLPSTPDQSIQGSSVEFKVLDEFKAMMILLVKG